MRKLMTMALALAVVTFAASCSSSAKDDKSGSEYADTGSVAVEDLDSLVEDAPAEEAVAEDEGVLAKLQPEDIKLPSQLKGVVEVLNGEDDYIPVTLDEHHFPQISITFKLLKTMDTTPLQSSYGQFWIYGVPQDAQGRDVKAIVPNYNEWRSDDGEGSMIKEFLEGEPDETITFTFKGESNIELFEKDQAKIDAGVEKTSEACKKVAKFKMSLKNDL